MSYLELSINSLVLDLGVDKNELKPLYESFINEIKGSIKNIEFDNSNENLKRELHNIKGISLNLMFNDFGDKISYLYTELKNDKIIDKKEMLDLITSFAKYIETDLEVQYGRP
jgi:hypothetical protein